MAKTKKHPSKEAHLRLLKLHDFYNAAFEGALPVRGDERLKTNDQALARELGVTAKTIFRDRQYLEVNYGLKIKYDAGDRCYAYTKREELPLIGGRLSPEEGVALAVGREALKEFGGVILAEDLDRAFQKVTGGTIDEEGKLTISALSRLISVRTPGAGVIADPRTFIAVKTALLRQRELHVEYRARGKADFEKRRLEPYHLACVENRWVLVARPVDRDEFRVYVLARFRNAIVSQKHFTRTPEFDPEPYVASALGVHSGRGKIEVKLRIAAVGAHHVLERRWHATQRCKQLPDGGVEVQFNLSDLGDLTRWVLSFGADCEVLEPKSFRATIAEEGRRMNTLNG
jgi:predicted DNA-binding transcriptional regulator YafY